MGPDRRWAWVKTLIEIPVSSYTIDTGNQLELKVIVGSGAASGMLIAYDTSAYPAVMKLPRTNETTPEGRPKVLQADSGGQIGRFRPSPNEGKLVYPLDGLKELMDAPWAVTYRVKTADPPTGFQYFTTATDITPTMVDVWEDLNLSAIVPAEATGAIIEVINNHNSNTVSGVVRGKADTRDYMASAANQKLGGRGHRWQIVKLDGNYLMQGYVESITNVSVKIIGYTYGTDPKFEDVPPDITPGTLLAWTTVDVST